MLLVAIKQQVEELGPYCDSLFGVGAAIKQANAVAQIRGVDNFLEEVPVVLVFGNPLPLKGKALPVCAEAVVLQFLIQVFENFFTIADRLIDLAAQVADEGGVEGVIGNSIVLPPPLEESPEESRLSFSISSSNSTLRSSVSTTGFLSLSQNDFPHPVIPNVATIFFIYLFTQRNQFGGYST